VAGGHDGPLVHNTVAAYDPQRNKWNLIVFMFWVEMMVKLTYHLLKFTAHKESF
jgi:hypothetical protein